LLGRLPHAGEAEVDVEVVAQHRTREVRDRGADRVLDVRLVAVADRDQLVLGLLVRRPRGEEVVDRQRVRPHALVVDEHRVAVDAEHEVLEGLVLGHRGPP
jgi:hypothetical protein